MMLSFLIDLLYPPACPGCGADVPEKGAWCRTCFEETWHPRLLSGSRNGALDGCYALGEYRRGLRKALIRVKYGGADDEKPFSFLIDQFPWWERIEADLVVPVPLSAQRERERGYNQTERLFRPYLERKGFPWEDVLLRIRDTKVQSRLLREERKENVRRAFHIRPGADVKGKSLLLVDDIYTTGATMKEAAKELKRAGARTITGLVIASGAR